jgi:hypothetical protein
MDWKKVVATVSPWLGTALGGPLGGAAVTAMADALGLSEKTEAAVKSALSGTTPEQMLALKKADQDFAVKMQEIGFGSAKDMESLAAGDRDSARKREMSVRDTTPRNLAYLITLGFFGVLAYMLLASVPQGSRDILNVMLGSLGTAWAGIVAYYFGSSSGSLAKTELLAKAEAIKD